MCSLLWGISRTIRRSDRRLSRCRSLRPPAWVHRAASTLSRAVSSQSGLAVGCRGRVHRGERGCAGGEAATYFVTIDRSRSLKLLSSVSRDSAAACFRSSFESRGACCLIISDNCRRYAGVRFSDGRFDVDITAAPRLALLLRREQPDGPLHGRSWTRCERPRSRQDC